MRAIGFAVAGVLVLVRGVYALDITACGEVVPAGDTGVLTADLNCATGDSVAVRLEQGATLDLNGHSVRGGTNIGIYCKRRRCTIQGPGEISDGTWAAVFLNDGVRLALHNVDIRNNDVGVVGSTVGRNRVDATNVTIEGNREWGLTARRLTGMNLTVRNNAGTGAFGLGVAKLRGMNITVSDNLGDGIQCRRARVTGLVATGNKGVGVEARRVVLRNSLLTGNDLLGAGVDLRTMRRPRLRNSTCDRSADPSGIPWGVCLND